MQDRQRANAYFDAVVLRAAHVPVDGPTVADVYGYLRKDVSRTPRTNAVVVTEAGRVDEDRVDLSKVNEARRMRERSVVACWERKERIRGVRDSDWVVVAVPKSNLPLAGDSELTNGTGDLVVARRRSYSARRRSSHAVSSEAIGPSTAVESCLCGSSKTIHVARALGQEDCSMDVDAVCHLLDDVKSVVAGVYSVPAGHWKIRPTNSGRWGQAEDHHQESRCCHLVGCSDCQ